MRQGMNTALIAAAAVVLSPAHYAPAPANEPLQGVVKASGITAPKVIGRSEASGGMSSACRAYKDPPKANTVAASSHADALRLWRQFQHKGMKGAMLDVNFVIALAPDPIHTHLSGYFDRTMDADTGSRSGRALCVRFIMAAMEVRTPRPFRSPLG